LYEKMPLTLGELRCPWEKVMSANNLVTTVNFPLPDLDPHSLIV
jgi:hypothetical protein